VAVVAVAAAVAAVVAAVVVAAAAAEEEEERAGAVRKEGAVKQEALGARLVAELAAEAPVDLEVVVGSEGGEPEGALAGTSAGAAHVAVWMVAPEVGTAERAARVVAPEGNDLCSERVGEPTPRAVRSSDHSSRQRKRGLRNRLDCLRR